MAIDPELLEIIRCPKCQEDKREGRLVLVPAGDALECGACRLRYRVSDGIPELVVDEAKPF
ncbi:Trm112 family protein [bacterium]|nr:Trm112 family protein [bacterium]